MTRTPIYTTLDDGVVAFGTDRIMVSVQILGRIRLHMYFDYRKGEEKSMMQILDNNSLDTPYTFAGGWVSDGGRKMETLDFDSMALLMKEVADECGVPYEMKGPDTDNEAN